jgi:hypothetical protein
MSISIDGVCAFLVIPEMHGWRSKAEIGSEPCVDDSGNDQIFDDTALFLLHLPSDSAVA